MRSIRQSLSAVLEQTAVPIPLIEQKYGACRAGGGQDALRVGELHACRKGGHVAPRQIPFHVGVTYFEIDQASPYWKGMDKSAGLALHVSGDFPNPEMALWAIRDR
jgi:type VI secretion system protein ImpJ